MIVDVPTADDFNVSGTDFLYDDNRHFDQLELSEQLPSLFN
jgi:hypothetical protein